MDGGSDAATALSVGHAFACAIVGGGVECWGANGPSGYADVGTLGAGSQSARGTDGLPCSLTPVRVSGLADVVAVSAGDHSACAIVSGGAVWCWGSNKSSQLGDGTSNDSSTPVAVHGLSGAAIEVSVGGQLACAVVSGGAVECWGQNQDGFPPSAVTGLTDPVTHVAVGFDDNPCVVTTGGAVKCWGNNANGALGRGVSDTTLPSSTAPAAVSGLSSGAQAVAVGSTYYACALAGGAVKCWGNDFGGQIGIDSQVNSGSNTPVTALASGASSVATGQSTSCAIVGGGVKCWGFALGTATTHSDFPVSIPGLSGVTALSLGIGSACAIAAGKVECWGSNLDGQLGDGTTTTSTTPVAVKGL